MLVACCWDELDGANVWPCSDPGASSSSPPSRIDERLWFDCFKKNTPAAAWELNGSDSMIYCFFNG